MSRRWRINFDGFIVALLLVIGIAYLFPQFYLWREGEVLHGATTVGVSLIFFFYGLKLRVQDIKSGLSNWRLHLLVQLSTFLLFPLLILPLYPLVSNAVQHNLWLSFFFLAALPSTVSSSVVMVSIARGNISAAIFNASISGLLGVMLTPLWMQFFLSFDGVDVWNDVYWGLIREIIIPVALGLLLQPYWGKWATAHSKSLSLFDKSIILLIVYSSFAKSFVDGIFDSIGHGFLLTIFIGVVVLFFLVYGVIYVLAKYVFRFHRDDLITALFCGSKKSLTHGSVFGKFLFAHSASAGLFFLPLMLYHAFQIVLITVIAQKYAREK